MLFLTYLSINIYYKVLETCEMVRKHQNVLCACER